MTQISSKMWSVIYCMLVPMNVMMMWSLSTSVSSLKLADVVHNGSTYLKCTK